ncbi:hypothetical protein EVAR_77359_1 [Eumeta japonica]|uniref:Uncharacterized protein n=1 Tax=Eumeta variegata TaxID=151549 RepID=A0A4C1UZ30_EUMVA|nr:hypothetical protein EVAR_77359_1 [Eumeta japonica]
MLVVSYLRSWSEIASSGLKLHVIFNKALARTILIVSYLRSCSEIASSGLKLHSTRAFNAGRVVSQIVFRNRLVRTKTVDTIFNRALAHSMLVVSYLRSCSEIASSGLKLHSTRAYYTDRVVSQIVFRNRLVWTKTVDTILTERSHSMLVVSYLRSWSEIASSGLKLHSTRAYYTDRVVSQIVFRNRLVWTKTVDTIFNRALAHSMLVVSQIVIVFRNRLVWTKTVDTIFNRALAHSMLVVSYLRSWSEIASSGLKLHVIFNKALARTKLIVSYLRSCSEIASSGLKLHVIFNKALARTKLIVSYLRSCSEIASSGLKPWTQFLTERSRIQCWSCRISDRVQKSPRRTKTARNFNKALARTKLIVSYLRSCSEIASSGLKLHSTRAFNAGRVVSQIVFRNRLVRTKTVDTIFNRALAHSMLVVSYLRSCSEIASSGLKLDVIFSRALARTILIVSYLRSCSEIASSGLKLHSTRAYYTDRVSCSEIASPGLKLHVIFNKALARTILIVSYLRSCSEIASPGLKLHSARTFNAGRVVSQIVFRNSLVRTKTMDVIFNRALAHSVQIVSYLRSCSEIASPGLKLHVIFNKALARTILIVSYLRSCSEIASPGLKLHSTRAYYTDRVVSQIVFRNRLARTKTARKFNRALARTILIVSYLRSCSEIASPGLKLHVIFNRALARTILIVSYLRSCSEIASSGLKLDVIFNRALARTILIVSYLRSCSEIASSGLKLHVIFNRALARTILIVSYLRSCSEIASSGLKLHSTRAYYTDRVVSQIVFRNRLVRTKTARNFNKALARTILIVSYLRSCSEIASSGLKLHSTRAYYTDRVVSQIVFRNRLVRTKTARNFNRALARTILIVSYLRSCSEIASSGLKLHSTRAYYTDRVVSQIVFRNRLVRTKTVDTIFNRALARTKLIVSYLRSCSEIASSGLKLHVIFNRALARTILIVSYLRSCSEIASSGLKLHVIFNIALARTILIVSYLKSCSEITSSGLKLDVIFNRALARTILIVSYLRSCSEITSSGLKLHVIFNKALARTILIVSYLRSCSEIASSGLKLDVIFNRALARTILIVSYLRSCSEITSSGLKLTNRLVRTKTGRNFNRALARTILIVSYLRSCSEIASSGLKLHVIFNKALARTKLIVSYLTSCSEIASSGLKLDSTRAYYTDRVVSQIVFRNRLVRTKTARNFNKALARTILIVSYLRSCSEIASSGLKLHVIFNKALARTILIVSYLRSCSEIASSGLKLHIVFRNRLVRTKTARNFNRALARTILIVSYLRSCSEIASSGLKLHVIFNRALARTMLIVSYLRWCSEMASSRTIPWS